ncbi:MAG: M15 family metallopeptidase [Alphaproteobacteria bacterium]|nr:M15 family metallopeptidase [Alphaproteobacteria bacterium]HPF46305.1 M15 family metallopeptidase [Emcibacteraceae bacterium]HRW29796.1 M15 family metallopeptidase [Emcibacteraceae bacterium]
MMMTVARKIFALCFVCFFTLNVYAADFDYDHMPPPAPEKWRPYYGEYTLGDQKLLFRENNGRFEVLYNPSADGKDLDKIKIRPLSELGDGKFTYSFNGEFSNFLFRLDDQGKQLGVMVNDDFYERHNIEPTNGNTFKVTLDKPIEDYIKDALRATPPVQKGNFRKPDLVDVTTVLEKVKLDIRYATTNNFLNAPTYSLAKSFIQGPALEALNKANKRFLKMGYGLLIHDSYRPWYVTKVFWDATEGNERDFVANPEKGSKHNMGSAVDLTLYDLKTGKPIKMVGTYDEMSDRSYPEYPGGTSLERWHRDLLRHVIEAEGFKVVSNEWWHFDHKDWQKYPILNKTFEELLAEK